MFSALVIAGTCCGYVGQEYRPIPAIHRRAPQECRPLPLIADIGTGGLGSTDYYRVRMGYQPFVVMDVVKAPEQAPFAKMMREVKKGFGRTMTRLPEVFGVSRQTLYNWLEGDTPKPTPVRSF